MKEESEEEKEEAEEEEEEKEEEEKEEACLNGTGFRRHKSTSVRKTNTAANFFTSA